MAQCKTGDCIANAMEIPQFYTKHISYIFHCSLGTYATSRAYINFLNHEDIWIFCEKFDGYVFLDSKGHEHTAIVEFAPFQKIPKKKPKKVDPKNNTIDKGNNI